LKKGEEEVGKVSRWYGEEVEILCGIIGCELQNRSVTVGTELGWFWLTMGEGEVGGGGYEGVGDGGLWGRWGGGARGCEACGGWRGGEGFGGGCVSWGRV